MLDIASVDRIEENIIVVELTAIQKMVDISKEKVNFEVEEGDILKLDIKFDDNNNIINIVVLGKDDKEKERRIKIIEEKLKKLTSME